MSFRNRCQVAGAEGTINLSIPLEKGRDQKSLLKDVKISDRDDWQGQHWKTIVSCYSRSPWFEFYRDELEGLYRKRFSFLLDWNLTCFEWSLGILKMPVPVSLTKEYHKNYEEENWADWRGKILPKNRADLGSFAQDPGHPGKHSDILMEGSQGGAQNSGDSAQNPVGPIRNSHISARGSHIQTQYPGDPTPHIGNPATPIKYRQVFEERIGFLPNLSILDLLFCEGKNARQLLASV